MLDDKVGVAVHTVLEFTPVEEPVRDVSTCSSAAPVTTSRKMPDASTIQRIRFCSISLSPSGGRQGIVQFSFPNVASCLNSILF